MVVVGTGMRETLADTLVCILQVVLAYETDVYHLCSLVSAVEECLPRTQRRCFADRLAHLAEDGGVEALVLHVYRHLVDARKVFALNHAVQVYVTETCYLLHDSLFEMLLGAENQDIWLNTYALQFLHGVLGRLCLQLACCLQIRHIGKVNVDGVLAQFPFQLSDSFHVRGALYVADGSANLGNHEVIVILLAEQLHVALDLVGDVRHHLDGFAEIIATTLLVDDCLVDTTSGERIRFRSLNAGESLVVSEVEVGLHTIYRYVALTMLIRVQCTRVDVDVWVKLLDSNVVTSCLKKFTDG